MNEMNFLISIAWAKGGRDVGDPILKKEKCCEGIRAPSTPQKSENLFCSFDIPFGETQIVFRTVRQCIEDFLAFLTDCNRPTLCIFQATKGPC